MKNSPLANNFRSIVENLEKQAKSAQACLADGGLEVGKNAEYAAEATACLAAASAIRQQFPHAFD